MMFSRAVCMLYGATNCDAAALVGFVYIVFGNISYGAVNCDKPLVGFVGIVILKFDKLNHSY